jgi:hypothetical protein
VGFRAGPGVGKPLERRGGRYKGASVTYQLEHVLCNKSGCRRLHGPYWYAYWRDGSALRKRYIGKHFVTLTHKDRNKRPAEHDDDS